MRIRMKESLSNGVQTWDSGSEHEIEDALAESWIASGAAEPAETPEEPKPKPESPRKRR